MASKQGMLPRLALCCLLFSSCAWSSNDVTKPGDAPAAKGGQGDPGVMVEELSRAIWKRVEVEAIQIVEEQVSIIVAHTDGTERHNNLQRREQPSPSPAPYPHPHITPPPSLTLYKRQNDAQIAQLSAQVQSISQASRSVSQASQQVSQSSQQLSNSLQQVQQQLSQTVQSLASARASADASRQSAEAANQGRNQASQAADQASRSADQAVSSISSSASVAIQRESSNAASSAASSAASVIAAMSSSAQMVMSSAASLVQAARADATAVRSDASTQILQAQGAAVSVTQAALAIVGAIIGSSLLTIAAFIFIRRLKRRRSVASSLPPIETKHPPSSPKLRERYPFSFTGVTPPDNNNHNLYPPPVKPVFPPPAARKSFHLHTAPKGKLGLFPQTGRKDEKTGMGRAIGSPTSMTSDYSPETEKARVRGSQMESPPGLEKWMGMARATVSPFETLDRADGRKDILRRGVGGDWPLEKKV